MLVLSKSWADLFQTIDMMTCLAPFLNEILIHFYLAALNYQARQTGFVQARFPAPSTIVSLSHGEGISFSKGRVLCVMDVPWRTTVRVPLP